MNSLSAHDQTPAIADIARPNPAPNIANATMVIRLSTLAVRGNLKRPPVVSSSFAGVERNLSTRICCACSENSADNTSKPLARIIKGRLELPASTVCSKVILPASGGKSQGSQLFEKIERKEGNSVVRNCMYICVSLWGHCFILFICINQYGEALIRLLLPLFNSNICPEHRGSG